MPGVVEQWKSQLELLSQQERAELAHFLLQGLEPEDDGVEAAWSAEVARRVDQIRSGNAVGRPAEEVFTELREQFP
jgi:putative addiction module component (TIGR02574 family)